MTQMTNYAPGTFCWVDLSAHDMSSAKRWYADLFGWEARDQDTGDDGPPYAMFTKDGKTVAGIGQMNDEMKGQGIPPMWNSYVSVESAEAVAARAKELGGSVMVPAMQVMDAGWLTFVQDPTGAALGVWQPLAHHGAQLVSEPGALCWNELATRDTAAVGPFYEQLFGWSLEEQPMGDMTYVTIKNGDRDNGGMIQMNAQWEEIPPHWMIYFATDDIDESVAKVESTGGKIHVPITDIPPGRFAVVSDPQGGVFSLIELRRPLA